MVVDLVFSDFLKEQCFTYNTTGNITAKNGVFSGKLESEGDFNPGLCLCCLPIGVYIVGCTLVFATQHTSYVVLLKV